MAIKRKISQRYNHSFKVSKPGLVAIFVSARCKSKKQINSNVDEDLRIEIDGSKFREIPPEKYVQLFNIPASWNGSKLKGLKKTIIFLTVLNKGEHIISLISRDSAFIEDIEVKELSGQQKPIFSPEQQAEDGDRRPWYAFVLADLPLKTITAKVTTQYRWWDSDDAKVIVDNKVQKQPKAVLHIYWFFAGILIRKFIKKLFRNKETQEYTFKTSLDQGIHYIEFWADKTPILHKVGLDLTYTETKAEIRAANIIKNNTNLIKEGAKEFKVDPVIVGAVIYQEQATNVNFVDTLSDYIGGLLHLNTSIGIGQIRVKTAELLEEHYPKLDPYRIKHIFIDYTAVRVERLKDPLTNIRYVAAKIHFSQSHWKKAEFDIKNKPEVLGTLYNIEKIDKPIEPHANPQINEFGQGVKKNYNKVKKLLGP